MAKQTKAQNLEDPDTMSFDRFAALCKLFKFTEPNDPWFLKRIVQLFQQDWFYGYVDRVKVQEQINKLPTSNKFIVRYSNMDRLCFSFKYKDEKGKVNWEHAIIEENAAWKKSGYKSYVEEFATQKGIEHDKKLNLERTFNLYQNK